MQQSQSKTTKSWKKFEIKQNLIAYRFCLDFEKEDFF